MGSDKESVQDTEKFETISNLCSRFSAKVDLFSYSFSQRVDHGDQKKVASVCGVVLSVLLILVLGSYSAYKIDVLINKKDNQFASVEFKDFYSLDDKFTHADGLSLAFAVVTSEPIDESYGYFSASTNEWTIDSLEYEKVGVHKCSLEELGIEGSTSSFYPIADSHKINL